MKTKTMKEFIKFANVPEELIRGVVRQIGGWDAFQEHAEDVVNHGGSGGFDGFIYYTDTCRFYAIYRDYILDYARAMAEDMGEEVMRMVQGFPCLEDAKESEVGLTLYGTKKQHDTQVANALAWFALEEVSRSYVDWKESA